MSEHISEKIAKSIDREELIDYYYSHLPKDTMEHFNICSYHVLNTVLSLFCIERMTPSQITSLQMSLMTKEQHEIRGNKISESHKGQIRSKEACKNMSIAQKKVDHTNFALGGKQTQFKKGQSPWNKGVVGVQKQSVETIQKRQDTMRMNKTFKSSKQEDNYYITLCEQYGEENVIRQYFDKERYPFKCDFYIKSIDLFIELNRCWTHGGMPFDKNNKECQEKLALWQEKSKKSKFYLNAIYTWTDLDVRKMKIAKNNNLNYKIIY